jgi:hypothetical protein
MRWQLTADDRPVILDRGDELVMEYPPITDVAAWVHLGVIPTAAGISDYMDALVSQCNRTMRAAA